jgi:K+-sensing histidine kinase KdpD
MLDDIINISKLESGRIPLKIETLQVAEIVKSVHQFIYLQIANRNFKLEITNLDPSLYIQADFERLRQVLISLVDAAINLINKGNIILSTKSEVNSNLVIITIDIPCKPEVWHQQSEILATIPEPTLEAVKNFSKNLEMSPSTKLLLAQTLLETMGGQLEITDQSPNNFTQINCLFPLVKPEFATQE